jgi:hypothetical protein
VHVFEDYTTDPILTAQIAATTRLIHGVCSWPALLLCPPRISYASPTPPNPLASGSDVGLELDVVALVVLSACWVVVVPAVVVELADVVVDVEEEEEEEKKDETDVVD